MTFGPWTPRHGSGWPSQFLKFSKVHHTCAGPAGMQGGNGAKMCKSQLGILGGIRGNISLKPSWSRIAPSKGFSKVECDAMSGICYAASLLQRFIPALREVTRVIGALFEPRRSSGARRIVAA